MTGKTQADSIDVIQDSPGGSSRYTLRPGVTRSDLERIDDDPTQTSVDPLALTVRIPPEAA